MLTRSSATSPVGGDQTPGTDVGLMAIFAEAATGISITSPAGRFLDANPAFCSMLGYDIAELRRVDLLDVFYPDDQAEISGLLDVARATDPGSVSWEKRCIRQDGGTVWVRSSVSVVRDQDRRIIHLVGTAEDVSARRSAEDALRRSQALIDIAGRIARVGGWSIHLPSMELRWSDVVAAIHEEPAGYSPTVERAIEYFAPEYQATIRTAFMRCAGEGVPYDLELQIITASGRRRWVRSIGQPERDRSGRIVSLHGAFQEVSDRKQAEQDTRELAARLQTTLESITDGLFTLDLEWRFTYVNTQAERLVGRRGESLLGHTLWQEFPAALGSTFEHEYTRAMAEQEVTRFEAYYPQPLDQWFEINAYPSAQGLAVYFRDMTSRKRDQDELRRANAELEARVLARTCELSHARDEAEQANRAKSAFLATMSHEIRTPMNGVIGMVDVLHQSSLKGYQVEMVDLIRDSADSLLKIIDDILDFSKIEAGKLKLETEAMGLADAVEKVCGMLDHVAVNLDVRLTTFIDPRIPRTVLGDETRLRQILVNLTANAIKFSGGQNRRGQVSVRAVLVEKNPEAVTIDLVVADNGIGMNDVALAQLFTPFSQADASTTRRFGGTGLGLAISGMLVSLLGGEISVQSAPGKGSIFKVRLSFATSEASGADPDAALVAGLQCQLVGGEPQRSEDLAAYLINAGAVVRRSSDFAAAAAAEQLSGLWLWLILPGQEVPSLGELRAIAPGRPAAQTRFIVLGEGKRRGPRVEAVDRVSIDADALSRRTLFEVLALAAGRPRRTGPTRPTGRDHVIDAPDAALRVGRILVAEDNETNRKVILRQLELIGYSADVAIDGLDALERWRSGNFSLLLTDLHMPEKDGFALAAAIRAEEKVGHRTPIIALTANALREEEARCLAAGMDAYLSKPVRLQQLKATIEQWLGPVPPVDAFAEVATPPETALVPADLAVLSSLVGDDPEVIADLLRTFREGAAQTQGDFKRGLREGSMPALAAGGHKLKSAARAVGAQRLGDICAEIEDEATTGEIESMTALITRFDAEYEALDKFLESQYPSVAQQ